MVSKKQKVVTIKNIKKAQKKMEIPANKCEFRLLNKSKTKVLVEPGPYNQVLKRFQQIEFFKHKRVNFPSSHNIRCAKLCCVGLFLL